MSIQAVIEDKLRKAYQPTYLDVQNESHMHSGPATQSHYNLTVVTDEFREKKLVLRHQEIYKLLAPELEAGVHALALHLYTSDEWDKRQKSSPASPACKGGSK